MGLTDFQKPPTSANMLHIEVNAIEIPVQAYWCIVQTTSHRQEEVWTGVGRKLCFDHMHFTTMNKECLS